jgi:hypothetical protein
MERTDQANFATARAATLPAPHRARGARRGIASVLAMLYLLIFSALALGFFTAVTIAAQIAHNDEKALGAQIACESGLEFVQYQLSRVRIPGNTPAPDVMAEVHKDLLAQQASSDNIAGRGIALDNNTIHFPAGFEDYVPLDFDGAGFRADVTDVGDGWLRVIAHGRYRGVTISRTIEMYFESVAVNSSIFDFGIVTRGPIVLNGNASIGGSGVVAQDNSVLSLYQGGTPLSMTGNPSIAGDAFMTNANGRASVSGGASVGGSSIATVRADHIHVGKPNPDPEIPTVDTSIFLPYVRTTYQPGLPVYRNVRIPKNTNPSFSSDVRIEGVMYVEYPNQLKFSGKTTVVGVIVVQNGAPPGSGSMKFTGQFEAQGMDALPATSDFPEDLRALRGSALLAPGFKLEFAGGAGTVGGTVVADAFSYQGHSGGTINGTLIALSTAPFSMGGNPSLSRIKPNGPIPAGLVFSRTYKPLYDTYMELRPGQAPVPLTLTQAGGWGGPVDVIVAALAGGAAFSRDDDGGLYGVELRHDRSVPTERILRRAERSQGG